MNVNDLKTSKFLKKEDVGRGKLVTIKNVDKINVALEGSAPEYKYAVFFEELDKPMVLNSTNGQLIGKITNCYEEIETGWKKHQIVLYNDPNVSFQGKLVGGIRIRAPKNQPETKEPEEDLPF